MVVWFGPLLRRLEHLIRDHRRQEREIWVVVKPRRTYRVMLVVHLAQKRGRTGQRVEASINVSLGLEWMTHLQVGYRVSRTGESDVFIFEMVRGDTSLDPVLVKSRTEKVSGPVEHRSGGLCIRSLLLISLEL